MAVAILAQQHHQQQHHQQQPLIHQQLNLENTISIFFCETSSRDF
ncbi:MAG TPA: hypothetical protein VN704_05605 [Verrucomicrobiae bacterium]|nr:hypothetical protein [Verrucomicrobiae bacterium]